MPADNTSALDKLRQRGQRGGNRSGRRPGLPSPKTPPATTTGEQASNDQAKPETAAPPVVPVDEQPVNPPEPSAGEVVDELDKQPQDATPEPEPPVVPVAPIHSKPGPDQRKRKMKQPSAPPAPMHRVNWNPEARQIRAELLGWCAARQKTAKRAADVARIVRKTSGDVPQDDLRAIVAEVAQRTGLPVEDVAAIAGVPPVD